MGHRWRGGRAGRALAGAGLRRFRDSSGRVDPAPQGAAPGASAQRRGPAFPRRRATPHHRPPDRGQPRPPCCGRCRTRWRAPRGGACSSSSQRQVGRRGGAPGGGGGAEARSAARGARCALLAMAAAPRRGRRRRAAGGGAAGRRRAGARPSRCAGAARADAPPPPPPPSRSGSVRGGPGLQRRGLGVGAGGGGRVHVLAGPALVGCGAAASRGGPHGRPSGGPARTVRAAGRPPIVRPNAAPHHCSQPLRPACSCSHRTSRLLTPTPHPSPGRPRSRAAPPRTSPTQTQSTSAPR
jgi:hypothetical protein